MTIIVNFTKQIITCNSLYTHEISAVWLIFVSGRRGQAHFYLGRGIKEMERYFSSWKHPRSGTRQLGSRTKQGAVTCHLIIISPSIISAFSGRSFICIYIYSHIFICWFETSPSNPNMDRSEGRAGQNSCLDTICWFSQWFCAGLIW